jgi:hypothetical protein
MAGDSLLSHGIDEIIKQVWSPLIDVNTCCKKMTLEL